ncbi:hypothetical protein BDY19DRAFT_634764 [Irpex rosettiformis]|uniref:Uncharacterized protein n=1 Tax=Irpex rosettiformis TaxID=378272 RepID=A0ACB8UB70_9APHY|nr:hypothetical protein BDY19DRAFT_634764 [Irpex rosettiformis]
MTFAGWRPTTAQSEPDDNPQDVKPEEEAEHEHPPLKMDEENIRSPLPSISAVSSAPDIFARAKREPAPSPHIQSPVRHVNQSPRFPLSSHKFSDMETDDDEFPPPFTRLPGLDVFSQKTMPSLKRLQPKKLTSGLSRVFQSMDVDDSDHSPSTSGSSPQLPTPGPSSRSHLPTPSFMKPSRSGLATGDMFSPRRSIVGDGNGSIDYASSPIRVSKYEEDEDDDQSSLIRRSYVFRGKKISAMLDHSVWNAKG